LSVGHDYYQIGEVDVSPNSEWLAFCEDTVGRRQYQLRFKNLKTGEVLSDTIADVEPDLAWANDNQTVLYIEKDKETLLGLYVKKHVLRTDPAQDVLVFEQTDKTLYTGISKSKSDRFLFIQMDGTLTSECHYADANDPTLSFKVFLPRRRGHEYEIEHLGDRFIVRTNWLARNFRLMWVPIGDEMSQTHWQDLVAHRDDTFIEDFDVFRRFVVLSVRSGGLRKLSVQPLEPTSAEAFFIGSDEAAYTTALSANPDIDSDVIRYTYSSLSTPNTVYDYNMLTGEKTLLKRDVVLGGYDPTRIIRQSSVRTGTRRQENSRVVDLSKRVPKERIGTTTAIRLRLLRRFHGSGVLLGPFQPDRSRLRLRNRAHPWRPGNGPRLVR
jgi:oligopeptidase B